MTTTPAHGSNSMILPRQEPPQHECGPRIAHLLLQHLRATPPFLSAEHNYTALCSAPPPGGTGFQGSPPSIIRALFTRANISLPNGNASRDLHVPAAACATLAHKFQRWSAKPLHGSQFGRCAVVASGGRLSGSLFGREIDSHDSVIRFNDAPPGGSHAEVSFASDVGNKTTFRVCPYPALYGGCSVPFDLYSRAVPPAWGLTIFPGTTLPYTCPMACLQTL